MGGAGLSSLQAENDKQTLANVKSKFLEFSFFMFRVQKGLYLVKKRYKSGFLSMRTQVRKNK